jgi:hypothetical protein
VSAFELAKAASNKRSLGSAFSDAKARNKLARSVKPPTQTPLFPLILPPAPSLNAAPLSAPVNPLDYQSPTDLQAALNSLTDDPERQARARREALSDAQELIGKLYPSSEDLATIDSIEVIEQPSTPAATQQSSATKQLESPTHGSPSTSTALLASPVLGLPKSPHATATAASSQKSTALRASSQKSTASPAPSHPRTAFTGITAGLPSQVSPPPRTAFTGITAGLPSQVSPPPRTAFTGITAGLPSQVSPPLRTAFTGITAGLPSQVSPPLRTAFTGITAGLPSQVSPPLPTASPGITAPANCPNRYHGPCRLPHQVSRPQSTAFLASPVNTTAQVKTTAQRKSVSAIIADLLAIPSETPGPTKFQFHLDHASAIHNGKILEAHNFSLASAIESDGNSPLRFGSEFRPVSVLEPLLGIHPLWERIKALLLEGSHFSADPLPADECVQQVEAALAYGNHKGAVKAPDKLFDLLDDDVTHGFNMPLPLSMVRKIPGLLMSPMNIARQNTIDELGNIVPKDRLTHDHSMEFQPQSSVNSRSRLEDHEPCHFGHALNRFFHILVHLRLKHPTRRILMTKIDWKAAYRRCHLDFDTALQCCTHLEDLILCALRLTFGGKPCPPDFSCISDTGSDLANDLVVDPTWEPLLLCSPHQAKMPPVPPSAHPEGELPHPGQPLLFDFPEEEDDRLSKFDNYIDDLIAAGVEIGDNIARMAAAGPLALHAMGRPLSESEPLPRDDNLSLKKFSAEALPEETKIVLGWLIDAWALKVMLPQDKYIAWSRSIQDVLEAKRISFSDLEELIGRLNHLCRVIRFATHFLGRLRNLQALFNNRKWAVRHIDADITKDLLLWLKCMKKAASGVSLNILVLRVATHLYRNDAAFHGIGGYSNRGRAWRYDIPEELRLRASINLLEFIGSILGPWVDFVEGNLPPESCIFSQGDNTTAASWLQKTNFASNKPAHLKVARRLANLLLEAEVQLTNEWIEGESNPLADSLSRDTHLSPTEHTAFLHSVLPQQMPDGFEIKPLPEEISSWLGSILQLLPASSEPCPRPTRSKLWSGTDGSRTLGPSEEPTILSSIPSMPPKTLKNSSPSSSAPLPKPFEQANFKPKVVKAWLQEQSKTTSDRWFKPSGLISGRTPRATAMVDYPRFYQGNMPVSKVKTRRQNESEPSASEF